MLLIWIYNILTIREVNNDTSNNISVFQTENPL